MNNKKPLVVQTGMTREVLGTVPDPNGKELTVYGSVNETANRKRCRIMLDFPGLSFPEGRDVLTVAMHAAAAIFFAKQKSEGSPDGD